MENEEKETISLKSILVKYLRHWKFFLVVFIISFIPAILYLKYFPVTYDFKASIQIQEEEESSLASFGLGEAAGLMKSFGVGSGAGSVSVDDEMAILMSNRMLGLMVRELGLYATYSKPFSFYKLYDDSPLRLTVDSAMLNRLDDEYRFTVSVSPGHINVKATSRLGGDKETFTYTAFPAEIKVGQTVFRLTQNRDVPVKDSYKLKIKCVPVSWVAEDLSAKIELEEVSSSSYVLDLTCTDHSKIRGREMLNVLIQKYNEDAETFKRIEDSKTMRFVDGRIDKIVADLAMVELDIEAYKTKNEITLPESDVMFYGEMLKELHTAIVEVESQSRIIDMLDEYVKAPANKYSVIPSLMAADGEKGGTISQYNEAIVNRDRVLKNSNETNPLFEIMNNQVEKLREGVYIMIENSRKNYNTTLKDLKDKEAGLYSKMRTFPGKEREYMSYRRNQEILQGVYLMLLQKREETVLSLGKQTDRARVIEPAYARKKRVNPRKLYAAIGMLVLTFVVPIGYFIGRDLFVSIREEYKKQ